MLKLFKKTLAVCLIGFGLRSIASYITSFYRLAIYYRDYNSGSGNSMAFLLRNKNMLYIKESALNESCCKKSS